MLHQALIPDDCQPRRPMPASGPGRVVNTKTAQQIAFKLAGHIGPALRAFAATGVVTSELHGDLARLYDLRRPETERCLDALPRYVLRHETSRGPGRSRAEDC